MKGNPAVTAARERFFLLLSQLNQAADAARISFEVVKIEYWEDRKAKQKGRQKDSTRCAECEREWTTFGHRDTCTRRTATEPKP